MTFRGQVEYLEGSESRTDFFERTIISLEQRTQAAVQVYVKTEPEEMDIEQFNGSLTLMSSNVNLEHRKSSTMISRSPTVIMEPQNGTSNNDFSKLAQDADFSW
ncbi:4099_t:CDS:1 [Cetraspora pellucida]|uniref:4099_t:CDS:1 n=1 Tax=Cetraspora pellucida TaxID=1433469 RepID=A0ACA9KK92_9GLOM|nr:4099_t:CDS:1 [Cetraspora pellucida]